MLPAALLSVYEQYKADTDSIAAWLASTAKALGYPDDMLSPPTAIPTPKSARLKGKARTDAKKAANQETSDSTKSSPLQKYIIRIRDFVPLAEHIATKTKSLKSVPMLFFETLNRAITVRSSFGDQLAEHEGTAPDEKSDLNHMHFVRVLEKVRDILHPFTSVKSTESGATVASGDAPSAAVSDLGSRFAGLKVYESSQTFLDAPDIERPKPTGDAKVEYVAEPLNSLYEAMVAYTMLMNDLTKIRSRIAWIWTKYRDGLFDSAVAAVTTNTAIDLARHIMEDVLPLLKDHGGAEQIANNFFELVARSKGISMERENGFGDFSIELYDIADEVYINVFRFLLSYRHGVRHKAQVPFPLEGKFGTYDAKSDRKSKSVNEKFLEDAILLQYLLPELITVNRHVKNYPVQDEFMRGMKVLDETGEVPFYLVFAAQIFLDIHRILRSVADRACTHLMDSSVVFHADLGMHLEFHAPLKKKSWPTSNDLILRKLQLKIQWIGIDPIFETKVRLFDDEFTELSRNRLLKLSPIIAGLMLYNFRAGMWKSGMAIANIWGSIQYSAHLYNALQRQNLLQGRWQDMDILCSFLDDSNFYVGGRPRNRQEDFKKFCLQMGATAAAFTDPRRRRAGARGRADFLSKAGPRPIKDGCPVSLMFMDRYLLNTGQVDLTPEHIDNIILLSKYGQGGFEEDGSIALKRLTEEELAAKKTKAKTRKKATEGAKLSPEALIGSLTFALQAETLEFAFPLVLLHKQCWKLLRGIKESCHPLLMAKPGPKYIEDGEDESQLTLVVGSIFAVSGGLDGGAEDDAVLQAAADVIDRFAESSDGAAASRALKFHMRKIVFGDEEYHMRDKIVFSDEAEGEYLFNLA